MKILIDWKKAENALKIKIIFKDGREWLASGNGLEIGEDIGEPEDVFFVRHDHSPEMIPVSEIQDIEIIEL